jgi:hypothetical protein
VGGVTGVNAAERGDESNGSGDAGAGFAHFSGRADYLQAIVQGLRWPSLPAGEGWGEGEVVVGKFLAVALL